MLVPCLDLPIADAVRPATVFFTAAAGLRVPSVVGLTGLVEMLLVPTQEVDNLGAVVTEPDLVPLTAPDRFGEEQWQMSDDLLDLQDMPRRLSGLLEDARRLDPELAALVALRAAHAFSPEVGSAVRQREANLLVAVDDGSVLQDEEYGGADLLIARARVDVTMREGGAVA